MTQSTFHCLKHVHNRLQTTWLAKVLSTTRINAQGHGAANPIASNATAEGREQNRRVEISIYAIQ